MGFWDWLFGGSASVAGPAKMKKAKKKKAKKKKRKTGGGFMSKVGGALGGANKLAHSKVGKTAIVIGATAYGGPAGTAAASAGLAATEGQGY